MIDMVHAGLAVAFLRVEEVDAALAAAQVQMTAMPREALSLAGTVFQRHRAGGGTRSGVLPDFFIGAHAAVAQLPLLARDVRRCRTCFPTVQLIAPIV